MSINLYQEAIVEAKQLRELAEQNAKNKIIEAVTPQIRSLIEQQLVGDEEEDMELVVGDEELEVDDEETIDLSNLDAAPPLPLPDLEVAVEEPVAEPQSKVSITVQGDLNMDLEEDDSEEEMLLSQEGKQHLEEFLREYSRNKSIDKRVNELLRKARNLAEAIGPVDFRKLNPVHKQIAATYYANLLKETYNLTNRVILINESVDERLENKLLSILKEIKNMSRRRDTSVFRKLFEELAASPGLYEQDEEALDVDVEEETEDVEIEEVPEEADVPAAQDALETLATALGMEASPVEEEEIEVEDEETVEVGEEELNLEAILREMADEVDEADETDEGGVDEVYEIDEASIRRELRRLRMLREQDAQVGRAAEADPALAHGGEDEGDVVVDVDEDDLLNALADELGDPAVPEPTVESRRRRRMRRSSRRVNESRNSRALRSRAAKAEKSAAHLKRQLQEMNLFNAKLLFANKLMQNRDLSTKQQRAIVEALDKASNIREAKLLYKSLSNSLNRRSGKTLNESQRRLLGSSSRSTRSAAPANSGAGADRWAVLAGINSKK